MTYIPKYQNRLKKFKKQLDSLSESEIGYLAGIIDGEGCLGLYRTHRKNIICSVITRCSIANTNKKMIDYITNLLSEGSNIYVAAKKNKKTWTMGKEIIGNKKCWSITIQHRPFTFIFLKKIIPQLIAKKEQAKLIVKFIEQRQGRFHSPYTYKELKLVEQSHKNNRPKS